MYKVPNRVSNSRRIIKIQQRNQNGIQMTPATFHVSEDIVPIATCVFTLLIKLPAVH